MARARPKEAEAALRDAFALKVLGRAKVTNQDLGANSRRAELAPSSDFTEGRAGHRPEKRPRPPSGIRLHRVAFHEGEAAARPS
jgi:hypothetical protein